MVSSTENLAAEVNTDPAIPNPSLVEDYARLSDRIRELEGQKTQDFETIRLKVGPFNLTMRNVLLPLVGFVLA